MHFEVIAYNGALTGLQPKSQPRLHLTTHFPTHTYLKYDDPRVDDVVEVDGAFVGVAAPRVAASVILVPIDAQTHGTSTTVDQRLRSQAQRLPVQSILLVQAAGMASLASCWHVSARHDAIVSCQGADEGAFIVLLWLVIWSWQGHTRGAGTEDGGKGERLL